MFACSMRLGRAGWVAFGLIIACLVWPVAAFGQTPTASESVMQPSHTTGALAAFNRFLASADVFYKLVNEGRLNEALAELKKIEVIFRSLPMGGMASTEGVDALADIIVGLKRTAVAVTPSEERWKTGAAKLRLAADALAHPAQPVWHSYKALLRDDMSAVEEAVRQLRTGTAKGGREAAQEALASLTARYGLIRAPVLLTSTDTFRVEQADAVLRYTSRLFAAMPENPSRMEQAIPAVREALEGVFPARKDAATFVPPVAGPPWVWPVSVGAFILSMLSWVGWRNYRADEITGRKN